MKPKAKEADPIPDSEGMMGEFLDGFISKLSEIKPASKEAVRERAWKEEVLPYLAMERVPDRFRVELLKWENPRQEKAFNLARGFLKGNGAIVALIGERGTGKTTIAAQILIQELWKDWEKIQESTGHYWRVNPYRKMAGLIARFKSLYADFGSNNTDDLIDAMEAICGADLMIIDELHECDDQKMKDRMLTDLLDRRYGRMRDTIVISNETFEQFTESTSDSILSRLGEHGCILNCAWESWRTTEKSIQGKRTR